MKNVEELLLRGVKIHAGCKVFGAQTSIGPGCVLGREAPATVEDCQLGEKVELRGGYFSGAVFLDGAAARRCGQAPFWKKAPRWRTPWA